MILLQRNYSLIFIQFLIFVTWLITHLIQWLNLNFIRFVPCPLCKVCVRRGSTASILIQRFGILSKSLCIMFLYASLLLFAWLSVYCNYDFLFLYASLLLFAWISVFIAIMIFRQNHDFAMKFLPDRQLWDIWMGRVQRKRKQVWSCFLFFKNSNRCFLRCFL